MKKYWPKAFSIGLILVVIISSLSVFSSPAGAISADIVISQVYGGGGNAGATYTHDFIELFNRGTSAVSLTGWSIQYTSATGTGNFGATTSQLTELPSVNLQPGQYFLIQEASSAAVGSPLPTADATDATPINMSGTAGKVAIVNTTTPLGCNGVSTPCSPAQLSQILDMIGYGSANFFEGAAAAPTLSNTASAFRADNGCTDTDNNSADFSSATPSPRNTASPLNPCSAGDAAPSVSSTTPSNGSTNVAINTNIDVTFSEAVNAGSSSFDVSCGTSGAHTFAVSGGPTSFTLDPDADFANSESCTVTVFAAQVTDQDANDPPDNMAADYVFSFDTVSVAPPVASLVINEIDYDQPGADTAEFIEIKNVSASAVDLDSYGIQLINGNGGAQYQLFDLPAVNLASGDYFVLCANASNTPNCDLDVTPNTDLIQNGAPDAAAILLGTTVIDTVSYEGDTVAPYTEGSGTGLEDPGTTGNVNLGISRFPDGVDTDQNNVDLSLRCITPGETNSSSASSCTLDLPPAVASTNPLNGAAGVAVGNNIDVNFTEPVTVTGNWFTVSCANSGAHTAAVSGGPQNYTLDPDVDFSFSESCSVTIVAANVTDQDGAPHNMTADYSFSFTTGAQPFACGDPATYIHDVQGNGPASPLVGSVVTIEGIVVGSFQGANQLGGFHVQEEDADADANPLTSEGVFVYTSADTPTVGDEVRVQATVDEFNGLTELKNVTNFLDCNSGNPLPAAASLSLPVTSVSDFEPYEGMLVTFPQALVISEYFNFGRYGEIVLTSERHLSPTAEFDPGPNSIQAAQDYLLDKITLDDGRTNQNPDPAIHPNGNIFDLSNLFRGGGTVQNVTGILDYSFGLYRVQPTQGATYVNANPRTSQPESVGGNVKVASFNVLNYFTTLTSSGSVCGPLANQDCRGADTPEEFTRQRDKIVTAISTIDADVVGLLEIENNPTDAALQDLVNGLNAAYGSNVYAYVSTGPIGSDAIKVAMIYKPASVTPVGTTAVLDSVAFVNGGDSSPRSRPSLAQAFTVNASGETFIVDVNHFKSKGSACDGQNASNPPATGEGMCNQVRVNAATALLSWLATDPTGTGDSDVLIIGDLNSYDKEEPIDTLVAGGFTDMVYAFKGEDAYSYVFDGQMGYLDYALASSTLAGQITDVADWHINSDEPSLIDYDMSFKAPAQDAIYAPDAYRSSDHDPVVVGINLVAPDTTAPDTTIDSVPLNPSTSASASFTFSGTDDMTASDDLTFECDLDGGGFSACVSPQNYTSLTDGSHTFQVRAIDSASNVDLMPASFTWTIDTVAPQVTLNQASGQADPTSASPIHFTVVFDESVTGFDGNDVVIGGTAGATTAVVTGGPATYDVAVSGMTGSGTVTVTVPANAAADAAGNISSASVNGDNTVTFTVIAPAPTCNGQTATIYVNDQGKIVGGPQNGQTYHGTLIGISGIDVIVGTNGADTILALNGNDVVCALSGNDFVLGGNGSDWVDAGAGADLIDGGLDADTLFGGDGRDLILGGPGADSLNGGSSTDTCSGGFGTDTASACEIKISIP